MRGRAGFRVPSGFDLLFFFSSFQTVSDRRTALYNKVVASYYKAKTERSALARELEIAQGNYTLPT